MQQNKIKQTDPDRKYRRVLAASTLTGDKVRNAAGEDLGKVDEIMIDITSGKIAYAVLSFGGILRMGNKLFAVPWGALRSTRTRSPSFWTWTKKRWRTLLVSTKTIGPI